MLAPNEERVYQAALRALALHEAAEDAEAEVGLMIGTYGPEASGVVALILIARTAGRACPFSESPSVRTIRPRVTARRRLARKRAGQQ